MYHSLLRYIFCHLKMGDQFQEFEKTLCSLLLPYPWLSSRLAIRHPSLLDLARYLVNYCLYQKKLLLNLPSTKVRHLLQFHHQGCIRLSGPYLSNRHLLYLARTCCKVLVHRSMSSSCQPTMGLDQLRGRLLEKELAKFSSGSVSYIPPPHRPDDGGPFSINKTE